MLAILNSLNAHSFPIFNRFDYTCIKFMVHRALSDKTYLSLGLLSPLSYLMMSFSMSRYLLLQFSSRQFFGLTGATG